MVDVGKEVNGEELLGDEDRWRGGRVVTKQDVRHLPRLLSSTVVRVCSPPAPQQFAALAVEDTLSETRLEQSTVGHSPPTRPHSPQREGGLVLAPRLLCLPRGGEGVVRLVNRGSGAVSWELAWPQSVLQVRVIGV